MYFMISRIRFLKILEIFNFYNKWCNTVDIEKTEHVHTFIYDAVYVCAGIDIEVYKIYITITT